MRYEPQHSTSHVGLDGAGELARAALDNLLPARLPIVVERDSLEAKFDFEDRIHLVKRALVGLIPDGRIGTDPTDVHEVHLSPSSVR